MLHVVDAYIGVESLVSPRTASRSHCPAVHCSGTPSQLAVHWQFHSGWHWQFHWQWHWHSGSGCHLEVPVAVVA